jgi:ATP-binding cassette subfamily B protein
VSTAPAQSWRGVATEDTDTDDLTVSTSLALAARSRALLGSLVRPHRHWAWVALVLAVAESVAALAGPLLIAAAIDTGVPAALHGRTGPVVWIAIAYTAAGVASAGLRAAFLLIAGRVGQDILLDLRTRVFRHVQRLSVSFHERYTSGRVISRLTSDLDSLSELLQQGLDELLFSLLSIVTVTVVLLYLDLPLAVVVLVGFGPLLALTRWYRRRSAASYRTNRTAIAEVVVAFVESMNGIRAVQAYRRERRNTEIMEEVGGRYRDSNARAAGLLATYASTLRAVGNVTLVVVLGYGAHRVSGGALQIGVLTAFVLYLRRLYGPLDQLAMFLNSYQSASAALEKLSGLLQEPLAVDEPAEPVALPAHAEGAVHFNGVEFAYSSAPERTVLHHLDLAVPAGQVVAVVGATGAGKSTVAKLLARFYDPTSGAITLDGVDLRALSETDLRRSVVLVTQESFLFGGSVLDNIALGRPGASRAEVESAARAVGAWAFIEALPDGIDTDVRKRGGRLSAGQRQLVAFARAFLADPAVLLLDEATSSMDVPSERTVQAALETVLQARTAVIIAHRLSTVLVADRVLVVEGGRVVEDGTPAELVAAGGAFAELHAQWEHSLA